MTKNKEDNSNEILKKRAQKLAKPYAERDVAYDYIEALIFKLAHEEYAIEIKYVKEVYPYKDLTFLPCAPSFVAGLVNVRRKIMSVIDLRVFFSLSAAQSSENRMLILDNGEMEFAVLTDAIKEVQKINSDHILPPLPTLTGVRQEFLKGVTKDGVVVLDGQKLLSNQKIIVNETVEI